MPSTDQIPRLIRPAPCHPPSIPSLNSNLFSRRRPNSSTKCKRVEGNVSRIRKFNKNGVVEFLRQWPAPYSFLSFTFSSFTAFPFFLLNKSWKKKKKKKSRAAFVSGNGEMVLRRATTGYWRANHIFLSIKFKIFCLTFSHRTCSTPWKYTI